jgi:hypothetical protein
MMPGIIAHSVSGLGNWVGDHLRLPGAVTAGLGSGRWGGTGRVFHLAPEVAGSGGRGGEPARRVLELCRRHLMMPENHSASGVAHGGVERAIPLRPAQLAQGGDEGSVGDSEIGTAIAAASSERESNQENACGGAGAYHAGKARRGRGHRQRRVILAHWLEEARDSTTVCRQRTWRPAAEMAL